MNNQRKWLTAIQFLKLSGPTIKSIECLDIFWNYFLWRFLSIDFLQNCLGMIESVNGFYHFPGVFLKQEHKELSRIVLDDFGEFLTIFSVQLAWQTNMSHSIYHELSVRLLHKGIFSFLWLNFRLLVIFTGAFLSSSGRLLKDSIFISTFVASHFRSNGWRSPNSLVTVIFRLVLWHVIVRTFYWGIRWVIVVVIMLLRNICTQVIHFFLFSIFYSLIGIFRWGFRIFWYLSLAFSGIVTGPRIRTFTLFLLWLPMLRKPHLPLLIHFLNLLLSKFLNVIYRLRFLHHDIKCAVFLWNLLS